MMCWEHTWTNWGQFFAMDWIKRFEIWKQRSRRTICKLWHCSNTWITSPRYKLSTAAPVTSNFWMRSAYGCMVAVFSSPESRSNESDWSKRGVWYKQVTNALDHSLETRSSFLCSRSGRKRRIVSATIWGIVTEWSLMLAINVESSKLRHEEPQAPRETQSSKNSYINKYASICCRMTWTDGADGWGWLQAGWTRNVGICCANSIQLILLDCKISHSPQ